tara:strand:- start:1993 stop:3897 length:1905 start_codon:yes stop_codon:yes gene_type:complete
MTNEEWASIARAVGLELLGEPKSETSKEIRWGNKGSVCLNVETGQFYDFEADKGYGVHGLLTEYDVDVAETLKRFGFSDEVDSLKVVNKYSPKTTSSLNRQQMAQLWQEAIIKVKYSDNFLVLRFPDGHYKSYQKYAPYCKQPDGSWVCKRPDGKLPLYVTPDRSKQHPVLLVEGEKSAMAAEHIYEHQVVCHHGGCKGWEKTDWSPLYGREVLIFPDNDEAGFGFADDISRHLQKHGSLVSVCKPPEGLQEKEDMHEAVERGLFADHADLVDYIKNNPMHRPAGTLYFERADQVLGQITEPEWLIKDIFERESLVAIFGKPKSGKSFVALDMAVAIARGAEYFGHKATKAPVVMLVGEGKRGTVRRLSVLEKVGRSLINAPLYLSNRGTRILDEDEYQKLIDELDIICAREGEIGCIIVDTLNRNFGAGSENSTEDMTMFISRLDNLIHKYKACVVIVHHTGHGASGRQRGSSVLGASMDYEFQVVREDIKGSMYVTLSQTLNKDGQGMANLDFKFNEVTLYDYNMTSGHLEIVTDKPKAQVLKNDTHIEINRALIALAQSKAIEQNGKPEDYWFSYGELVGHAKTKKGTDMHQSNISEYIKKMHENDTVTYDAEKNVYQAFCFRNEVNYGNK